MENKEYLTKTELKERGFTDSIIRKLNITPDLEKDNPHYKSASPMLLFEIKKIEKIEETEEFLALLEKSKKRKKSAQKAVETKEKKAEEYLKNAIDSLIIDIDKNMSYQDLEEEAKEQFNYFQLSRPSVENGNNLPADFDYRPVKNIINHIRHNHTNYEELYQEYIGKVGIQLVHDEIQNEINKKIEDFLKERYNIKI